MVQVWLRYGYCMGTVTKTILVEKSAIWYKVAKTDNCNQYGQKMAQAVRLVTKGSKMGCIFQMRYDNKKSPSIMMGFCKT